MKAVKSVKNFTHTISRYSDQPIGGVSHSRASSVIPLYITPYTSVKNPNNNSMFWLMTGKRFDRVYRGTTKLIIGYIDWDKGTIHMYYKGVGEGSELPSEPTYKLEVTDDYFTSYDRFIGVILHWASSIGVVEDMIPSLRA